MVSQGLEQLEEGHKEKSEVQRTRDATADAEMGKWYCYSYIFISRSRVLCCHIKNDSFIPFTAKKIILVRELFSVFTNKTFSFHFCRISEKNCD